MATYGLANFVYDLEVDDGAAHFRFHDPEDASNTAEVSIDSKDFPDGVSNPDSRQVADLAYAQCAKVLNDKRDARLNQAAHDKLEAKTAEDARAREAAADFHNNSQDVQTAPHHVDEDGTAVYNTEKPRAKGSAQPDDKKK